MNIKKTLVRTLINCLHTGYSDIIIYLLCAGGKDCEKNSSSQNIAMIYAFFSVNKRVI